MVERKPLVLIDGQIQTLPDGDTIAGASGGGGGSGDGYSSESVIITLIAGESLARGCVVNIRGDFEDDYNPKVYNFYGDEPLGIANQSVSAGQSVDVIVSGKAFIPDSSWALHLIPDEPNPDIEITFPTNSNVGDPAYVDNDSSAGELTVGYPAEGPDYIYSMGTILSGGTGNAYILVRPTIVYTPLVFGGG